MNAKRTYYLLAACLVILTAAGIGSIVLGDRVLNQSAGRLNDLKLQTNVIDEQQNSLSKARKDIQQYQELVKIAQTIVPQEKDQARTVREIVKFAAESNVPIASITFPNSDLGDAAESGKKKTSSTKTTSSSITQVEPVEGIKGVYQLEIVIQNDSNTLVRYPALIEFLSRLEQNRRTSQVTNLDINPSKENRNFLTYSMTINVYIKP